MTSYNYGVPPDVPGLRDQHFYSRVGSGYGQNGYGLSGYGGQ